MPRSAGFWDSAFAPLFLSGRLALEVGIIGQHVAFKPEHRDQ
jgi:hypothetical protein